MEDEVRGDSNGLLMAWLEHNADGISPLVERLPFFSTLVTWGGSWQTEAVLEIGNVGARSS